MSRPRSAARRVRIPRLSPVVAALAALTALACGPAGQPTPARSAPPVARGSGASGTAAARAAAYPDDAAIARAGDDYLALFASIHPEEATALGLHDNDAELDDRSIAGHDAGTDRQEALLRSLEERFADPKASPSARTDLALLLGALRCDIQRKRVQRPLQRKPDVYVEPLNAIFQMTAREYAPAAERAQNVIARLEKIPAVVEQAKANVLNPPRVWTEIAIDRASSAKPFLAQQRPFLASALPAETARIDAALAAATRAYEDYGRFLQKTVLPRSNGGFSAGRELFELLLKQDYFLEEGADELLAMGKKLFAETNAQMLEVARRIDPSAKDWPEVTARLKAKHPPAGELLGAYRREVARARAFLVEKDVVAFPPDDDLEVVDTPAFMRSTITAAYDQPPPFDARTSKGFFFVTPVDEKLSKRKQEEMLRENDWGDIVDTSVHEAYPGHHLQLSFARRNPSRIRRAFDRAIFSEGWALYSEELMAELGYYDDAERLIQLEWSLVRAARIVLDVGLHVGDMTFEQAVKVLTDEVHLERSLALSEVKRYTESPTQPSAYMVGRQKIFELRERARRQGGASFSLKAFHTDLLSRGTVPPSLLAREMFGD
ncbi:MAG: DUF885 domain-containing protein [Labilithrix sp.]|nr:DUF885 domain-containing protein [Labilithrix sp.]